MSTNLDRFKQDLSKLVKLGHDMDISLRVRASAIKGAKKDIQDLAKKFTDYFENNYQAWYSEALLLMKQLLPDRLSEFNQLYNGDGKRKFVDVLTFNIQDWLNGTRAIESGYSGKKVFDDLATVSMRFSTQLQILKSVQKRFESSLFDIAQLVRADLFDSELDAARELAKKGFLRGAGAIAGVVLEKHLAQVSNSHSVTIRKQHPAISDFNDPLKNSGVLDVPTWRQIQRLGDIRNLCDHNKQREPKKEEVVELIDGVERITKTIF